ncbi:MAG: DUF2267 domain-containing protein [Bradymonadaceae bacterium]
MSSTGLRNLDHALQTTNEWIRELDDKLGWDNRQQSYMALKAVLHGLRDQLTVEEGAHFAAQLPLIVRGVYYDGWKPSKVPVKDRDLDKFLDRVRANYKQAPGPDMIDATWICRAVISLLTAHISQGELDDVRGMLPKEIVREVWPTSLNGGQAPQPRG